MADLKQAIEDLKEGLKEFEESSQTSDDLGNLLDCAITFTDTVSEAHDDAEEVESEEIEEEG